ncbi:MAG: hypothetical protein IJ545_04840 [Alphaproteobacteria bacterium]|nr:hypothetical protein [Alphaproteobacteria bacterium]
MVDLTKIRKDLEDTLPPIVLREDVPFYKAKTLRQYDSNGTGIPNKFKVHSRKVAYPKEDVINWIISHMEATNAEII